MQAMQTLIDLSRTDMAPSMMHANDDHQRLDAGTKARRSSKVTIGGEYLNGQE